MSTGEPSPEAAEVLPCPFGQYVLLESMARGGMATIHLARALDDPQGRTPLVIKRLHPSMAENATLRARLRHEGEIAVSVDSPHVVRVLDVGAVGDVPFIAMEHVLGSTLGDLLRGCSERGQPLPSSVIAALFAQALLGLDALHRASHAATGEPLGVVHRDLSPRNLMVAASGRMVIIDLGIGRSNLQLWRTRAGALLGTPGYVAPEQARGDRIDARADLYAIGILLFEALSLERWVVPGELGRMVEQMCRPPPLSPGRLERVPPSFHAVLGQALAEDPGARFDSAASFREALLAAVPAASSPEILPALPGTLRAAWVEREAAVAELLRGGGRELPPAVEEPTEIFAHRVITAPVLSATELVPRPAPVAPAWGAIGLMLLAVSLVVAVVVATRWAPEMAARPVELVPAPEPTARPRPVAAETLAALDGGIAPDPSVVAGPRRVEVGVAQKRAPARSLPELDPAAQPSAPQSEAALRARAVAAAKEAARRLQAHPDDPELPEAIAQLHYLLALPSLEGHEQELLDRLRSLQRKGDALPP